MDERARDHLELKLETESNRCHRTFDQLMRGIVCEQSANRVLGSGSMVRRSLEVIEQMALEYTNYVIKEAHTITPDAESFSLATKYAKRFLLTLKEQLPRAIKSLINDKTSTQEAWQRELNRIEGDLNRQLNIAEFDFDKNGVVNPAPKEKKAKPKKTPLPKKSLDNWWESKRKVRDAMSQADLLADIRKKYPDNFISRERIRKLTEGRKRGPKAISR